MLHFVALAAFIAVTLPVSGFAASLNVTSTVAVGSLVPPLGTTINRQMGGGANVGGPPGIVFGPLSTPSTAEITINDEFDSVSAKVSQAANQVSSIEYTNSANSGRDGDYKFRGNTQLFFDVTNSGPNPAFMSYEFSIKDSYIEIARGYGDSGNPFQAAPDRPAGVQFEY